MNFAILFAQDDTVYDTVFQTTRGEALILRVHIPPTSAGITPLPPRAPNMTLVGVRAEHDWLDARHRVVGYAPIRSDESWNNSRILLGAAVHQVVEHFQLNPPRIIEITDPGLQKIQTSISGNPSIKSNASSSTSSTTMNNKVNNFGLSGKDAPPDYHSFMGKTGHDIIFNQEPPMDIQMPVIPTKFDELETMDRDALDKLMDDDVAFLAFFNKLPTVQELREIESSIISENAKMARANLELEPKLKELHAQVKYLHEQLRQSIEAFSKLEEEQDRLAAPPDPRIVMKQLNQAKKEAFDQSERLAEEWVESGRSGDDFVDKFLELRILHHTRAAKLERLQQSNDASNSNR